MIVFSEPSSAPLTSTTSPDSGEISADTALVDSSSPYSLSFVTFAPTSGWLTNTTSPRVSCAYQVIPNVAMSPSTSTQSWASW